MDLIVGKLNFTKLPGVEVAKSSLRLERKEFNLEKKTDALWLGRSGSKVLLFVILLSVIDKTVNHHSARTDGRTLWLVVGFLRLVVIGS